MKTKSKKPRMTRAQWDRAYNWICDDFEFATADPDDLKNAIAALNVPKQAAPLFTTAQRKKLTQAQRLFKSALRAVEQANRLIKPCSIAADKSLELFDSQLWELDR